MFLIFIPAALLFRATSVNQIGAIFQTLFKADFSLTAGLNTLGMTGFSLVSLTLTLSREGYTLIGWNTRSDGMRERVGLGSRVTPVNGQAKLYA